VQVSNIYYLVNKKIMKTYSSKKKRNDKDIEKEKKTYKDL